MMRHAVNFCCQSVLPLFVVQVHQCFPNDIEYDTDNVSYGFTYFDEGGCEVSVLTKLLGCRLL